MDNLISSDDAKQKPTGRIRVRSRRQALDWSLVLISQEIEPTIEYDAEGQGWGLVVPAQDYENAIEAIRQYQVENRGWPWQREWFTSGVLFDAGSIVWAGLVVTFYGIVNVQPGLQELGIMDSGAVGRGEWWRLFTAILLHADVAHLATNVTLGVVLLGLAMGRYGTGVGLLAAYLAGVGGNLASWWAFGLPHRSLGASGMVTGALGLLAVQSVPLWFKTPRGARAALSGLAGGGMLFVLLGLTPGTNVVAHLGGFVSGLGLGLGLRWVRLSAGKAKINLASGLLLGLLLILTWGLAMAPQK